MKKTMKKTIAIGRFIHYYVGGTAINDINLYCNSSINSGNLNIGKGPIYRQSNLQLKAIKRD